MTTTVLAVVLVLGTAAWADGQIRGGRTVALWKGLTMEHRVQLMERKARVVRQVPGGEQFDPIAAAEALGEEEVVLEPPPDLTKMGHASDVPQMFPDVEAKCPDGWIIDNFGVPQMCIPAPESSDSPGMDARASMDRLAWPATTRNVVRERPPETSPAAAPAAAVGRWPTAAEAAKWAEAGPEGPAPRAADFVTADEYQEAYDVWHQRHADRLRGEEIEREKAGIKTGKTSPTAPAPATH